MGKSLGKQTEAITWSVALLSEYVGNKRGLFSKTIPWDKFMTVKGMKNR